MRHLFYIHLDVLKVGLKTVKYYANFLKSTLKVTTDTIV
nr:hypothetical protein [Escherichia coli]